MEIITGYTGTPHVTAEQDRDLNQGIIGTGSYVLSVGNKLRMEIRSNNEIRIYDGMIVHQGCAASIGKNKYDSLTIENGSQGMKRKDLVVARYSRQGSGEESVQTMVIKGTPAASNPQIPKYKTGDIQLGDTVDMPLYSVELNGLSIVGTSSLFEIVKGTASFEEKCAYSFQDYHGPEVVVNAGDEYTIKSDTIYTSGRKCLICAYGGIKTSDSAAKAVLSVRIDGEKAVDAITCSTADIGVYVADVIELNAGKHDIAMVFYPNASMNVQATLCANNTYGMTCVEI